MNEWLYKDEMTRSSLTSIICYTDVRFDDGSYDENVAVIHISLTLNMRNDILVINITYEHIVGIMLCCISCTESVTCAVVHELLIHCFMLLIILLLPLSDCTVQEPLPLHSIMTRSTFIEIR